MIKTKNLVPEVYYDQSRDFQFFGRVHEIVYNYIKTNIDLMTGLPLSDNVDLSMINLLLTTLGFTRRHVYNAEDLKKICGVFVELLRLKGSKKSVELAIATLMNAQNLTGRFDVIDTTDELGNKLYSLDIYLPKDIQDLVLLEDIFDYILPAGYTYRFSYTEYSDTYTLPVEVTDTISVKNQYTNSNLSKIAKPEERDKRPENTESNDDLGITYTGVVYIPEGE